MIKIVNQETGEEIIREFTPEEQAEREERQAKIEAERLAEEQAEEQKQAKLESAKAKLTALGLDQEEVEALLGL